jgi:predicted ATPase
VGEERLAVLGGAWLFHVVRGELRNARDLGQRFLDRAREQKTAVQISAGHFLIGSTLFHMGDFENARKHLEESAALQTDDTQDASVLALDLGPDVRVFDLVYLSHVLFHLGDSDQAAAKSANAIARAEELAHPFSLAIALTYTAMLHLFGSDNVAALARAEEAIALCEKYQFAYYLAVATILAGAAKGLSGAVPEGLAQLKRGLEDFRSTGAEIRLPFYYLLLSRVCDLAGHAEESAASLATGRAFERKNSEIWVRNA